MIDLRTKVTARLDRYHILPNEKLGQHFLINDAALEEMINGVDDTDVVIEVGPGLGQLTERLCDKAYKVIAIEIDRDFYRCLKDLERSNPNLELIFKDFLKINLENIIRDARLEHKNIKIVSSLPYHITEPFLNKVAKYAIPMTLMVGEKFARLALNDDPGNNFFSELSYLCSSFFEVIQRKQISRSFFVPEPGTDSVILEFKPKTKIGIKDYISQRIIVGQKHGPLIKSALVNALISYHKGKEQKVLTKNMAREIVGKLNLSDELLNKPFSQLKNEEVRLLASCLDTIEG